MSDPVQRLLELEDAAKKHVTDEELRALSDALVASMLGFALDGNVEKAKLEDDDAPVTAIEEEIHANVAKRRRKAKGGAPPATAADVHGILTRP